MGPHAGSVANPAAGSSSDRVLVPIQSELPLQGGRLQPERGYSANSDGHSIRGRPNRCGIGIFHGDTRMIRTCRYSRTVLALSFLSAPAVLAQGSAPATTFNAWVNDRIAAAIAKAQVGINGKSTSKQTTSPSATSRSTSLVDQSSATDFVSTALSLVPVNSANG